MTPTDRGFDVRFVDDAGHVRDVSALITPSEWMSFLWDWTQDDGALAELVQVLRASPGRGGRDR